MKFELITLFPEYFELSLRQSLLGRALEKQLFEIRITNPRDYATDRHRTVDDTPFGGGGGMVMKVEPLDRCLKALGCSRRSQSGRSDSKDRIILTSAAGRKFDQQMSIEYSLCDRLTIICGHYQGVDERITQLYEVDEVSIGDYVLTGGEPAAAVMIDAVVRLLPKVLGNFESATGDSHMEEIVGAPSYTRPAEYENLAVPEALLSGNHGQIDRARRLQAIEKCFRNRPELLQETELSDEEIEYIKTLKRKIDS